MAFSAENLYAIAQEELDVLPNLFCNLRSLSDKLNCQYHSLGP